MNSLARLAFVGISPVLLFGSSLAAQKPGLPPGIYFIWSPPGPRTTSPDHPNLPNFDYARDQSHENVNAARDLRQTGPAEFPARAPTDTRRVVDLLWFRIATANEGDRPPDLHQGGTDQVQANRTALFWLGNEGVTAHDSVYVTARILRADDVHGAPVTEIAPDTPIPAGSWGSKSAMSLGTLPAGQYLVRIHLLDRALGLDAWLERRVDAR